jgi:hypothetical protein
VGCSSSTIASASQISARSARIPHLDERMERDNTHRFGPR